MVGLFGAQLSLPANWLPPTIGEVARNARGKDPAWDDHRQPADALGDALAGGSKPALPS